MKLEEALLYQKILVRIDEEEGWLNEKIALVSNDEVGDSLAAVQVHTLCYAMNYCKSKMK